jgi:hypothetical protein
MRYAYIADPWTDYETIYERAHYRGEGTDQLVNYAAELDGHTIRTYEWEGIARHVAGLRGCPSAFTGSTTDVAQVPRQPRERDRQTPVVGDLDEHRGEFDVMPSWLLATVADRVTRLSAHPIGWIVSRPSQ